MLGSDCEVSLCGLTGNFGAAGGGSLASSRGLPGDSSARVTGNGGGGGGATGCIVLKSETAADPDIAVGVVRMDEPLIE